MSMWHGTLMLGEFSLNSLSDLTVISNSSQSFSTIYKICMSPKPVQNMPVEFKGILKIFGVFDFYFYTEVFPHSLEDMCDKCM